MRRSSEGFRRLGILCGGIASLAWVLILFIISDGFSGVEPAGWAIVILGAPTVFVVVVALIWGIDWVIAGFGNEKQPKVLSQGSEDLGSRIWTRVGQKKCARCGHIKRDHADINTLNIEKCRLCPCLEFAEE